MTDPKTTPDNAYAGLDLIKMVTDAPYIEKIVRVTELKARIDEVETTLQLYRRARPVTVGVVIRDLELRLVTLRDKLAEEMRDE